MSTDESSLTDAPSGVVTGALFGVTVIDTVAGSLTPPFPSLTV